QGCDASVLIDSTKYNQAEKDAIPNLSLRGFGVIDRVKAALEMECPGIVSCSDILAIVARDVTVAVCKMETGRKDGRTSIMNEALFGLIPPSANISFLISGFKAVGLSIKDLVVLISHCSSFTNRIYNFTGNGGVDPTMDSAKRRALFQSDAAMLDNAETKAYVEKSLTVGSTFLKDFGDSMVKMGRIGVLTGDAGEIRKVCYKINDQ
ncbi:Peroxidase 27, partial [Linum grandiflorum]